MGRGSLEHTAEPVIAALASHLERGEPLLTGGPVELHAAGHEHLYGRELVRLVGTEPDGLVDRLVADPVHVVLVDPGTQQASHDEVVTTLRRPDQSRAVPAVLGVDVRTGGERQLEDAQVALAGGDEIGGLLRLVLGLDVRSTLDEPPGGVEVVLPRGGPQRRVERRR